MLELIRYDFHGEANVLDALRLININPVVIGQYGSDLLCIWPCHHFAGRWVIPIQEQIWFIAEYGIDQRSLADLTRARYNDGFARPNPFLNCLLQNPRIHNDVIDFVSSVFSMQLRR